MDNFPAQKMKGLLKDAATEFVERQRVDAQLNRLVKIMSSDIARLNSIYTSIGKIYVDGTMEKNAAKLEVYADLAEHLRQRILRAKERYYQLKEARNNDKCAEALKQELQNKIAKARADALDFAHTNLTKAKFVAEKLTTKRKSKDDESVVDDKTRRTALLWAQRIADEKGEELTLEQDDDSSWNSFKHVLEELTDEEFEASFNDFTPDELASSGIPAEEANKILHNIENTLEEVYEDEVRALSDETSEKSDDESAEGFTFS